MKLIKKHKYLIYGVLAIVVIAVVVSMVQKSGRKMAAKAAVKRSEEAVFVPDPYASSIYTDLNKGWFSSSDADVYSNVLNLKDEEIRLVWEFYEVEYKPKKGAYQGLSMRAAIDEAQFYFTAGVTAHFLVNRLLELKLP